MPPSNLRRTTALTLLALVASCCGGCLLSRAAIYPGCSVPCDPAPGVEVVAYEATDGALLQGAWVRSGGESAPVLVWFHGNAESAGTNVPFARALARRGLDVFLAEYRGYGGLPGSPDEDGLYADGEGALAMVATAGVPPDRIVLGGRSLGTGVAVELACQSPVRGLVLVSPYTSIVDLGRRIVGPLAPLLVADSYATIEKVGRIDVPIVVLHGAEDTTIPPDHGRAVAAAAKRATFRAIEGADHNGIPGIERLVVEAVAEVMGR